MPMEAYTVPQQPDAHVSTMQAVGCVGHADGDEHEVPPSHAGGWPLSPIIEESPGEESADEESEGDESDGEASERDASVVPVSSPLVESDIDESAVLPSGPGIDESPSLESTLASPPPPCPPLPLPHPPATSPATSNAEHVHANRTAMIAH
jgi:hypothetical protein